eukprot:3308059-Prymnesium_polylepis.1
MMLKARVTSGASLMTLKVSRDRQIFYARLCACGHQAPRGGVNKNSILSTPRPWSVRVCYGVTVSRVSASSASSDARYGSHKSFATTGVCAARSAAAKFWGLMMLKAHALAFLTLLKAKSLERFLMLLKRIIKARNASISPTLPPCAVEGCCHNSDGVPAFTSMLDDATDASTNTWSARTTSSGI